ncbi:MAG: hypothetical protein EPN60_16220 [Nevskiaceae bacterium]|nr:MAG: hypothetical protein EPN60_16220 [Nevskiaceae bacterium]
MKSALRSHSILVVAMLCIALAVMWGSGAHSHWHLGDQGGVEHENLSVSSVDDDHDHHHAGQAFSSLESAAEQHSDFSPSWHWDHAVDQEDVKIVGVGIGIGKLSSPDAPLLALLFCAALLLPRRPAPRHAVLWETPPRSRVTGQLRPPLRGPPSISVA